MVDESNPRHGRRHVLRLISGMAGLTIAGIGNVTGQRTSGTKIGPNELSSKLVGMEESVRLGDWSQQMELVADDRDENDYFGSSVAVSGDGTTAVIGALGDDDPNGEDAGSTYVFENADGEWTQQSKLAPDDGDDGDKFGGSAAVSRDGTTALIGSYLDNDSNGEATGSVYVYEESGDGWTQQSKLIPDDGDENDAFGGTVAVSENASVAVIGAFSDADPNGEYGGSAYVFEHSDGEWTQQSKLAPDDGDDGDYFGGSVAVSGDGTTAILGASGDENPNGEAAGSAYVFESAGGDWTQQTKLTPDDGDDEDSFGSVTISGDGTTAIIGASGDDDPNGEKAGSAYVFGSAGGEWTQQSKLAPDDGDAEDFFGRALAVSRDGMTAIFGAFTDVNPNGEDAGSAYVFERSDGDWDQQKRLVAEDGNNADSFGISVAISGDGSTAIIGANGDGFPSKFQAGSAYVFGTGEQPPETGTPTEDEASTDSESDEDGGQSIPGFGLGSALAGLTGAGYLRWRNSQ